MKNDMTPQQKKEVRLLLKKELFRQGIRHPRVPLEAIEEMELKELNGKWKFYARIDKMSFYAWIDKDTEEVVYVQVIKRH